MLGLSILLVQVSNKREGWKIQIQTLNVILFGSKVFKSSADSSHKFFAELQEPLHLFLSVFRAFNTMLS